jgi:peptidoglycan-N-acetylglucosamine deacetylase
MRRFLSTAALLSLLTVAAAQAASGGRAPREFRAVATVDAPPGYAGALTLVRVSVGQVGHDLSFAVRTASAWHGAELARHPGRTVCLLLAAAPSAQPSRQVCVRARGRSHQLALDVGPAGGAGRARPLDAEIERSDARSLEARFDPAAAGVRDRYAWRVEAVWTDAGRCAARCTEVVPTAGVVAAKLTPVRPLGCTRPRQLFVTQANTRRRVVALTFDDGPSPYTPSVLRVLERAHVNATFFLIGRQVAGGAAFARRALRDGDVVGNHTWNHANLSGGGAAAAGQLRETNAAIERATGFRPCLFRAPYGSTSGALERVAAGLGLTTIQWNVDPRDWSLPGTGAIVSRVLGAVRPGAIVIMHDGGGPRQETVAALPQIIAGLHRRGYTLETVPQLLGQTVIYGR